MKCDGSVGQGITGLDRLTQARWDDMVTAFLAHSRDTPQHLGAILEDAPRCAAALAVKGLFFALLGRAELIREAGALLLQADKSASDVGATWREHQYIEALRTYLAGHLTQASAILQGVLKRHPDDSLAFKLDHAILFVLGKRRDMLQSVETFGKAFGEDHPHHGYVLGCRSFAQEENGHYADAERSGREALERSGDDAWGLHAVAHVYDMTGRAETGVSWLETQTNAWAHCNNFGYHVWWHLGLFYLDKGAFDRVLALYDDRVRAEHTDDYRDIANGASMLMRLEIEGVDVGHRWEELAALATNRVEPCCVVFADLHYMLALNGDGRDAAAGQLIDRLARDAQSSDHEMHEVAAVAGLPTALGLAAFRAGRYGAAFDLLREARPTLGRIGGSHAQRDVFSRLLIEAGIRAQRYGEAEAELAARTQRRGAEDGFTARRRDAISRAETAGLAAE
ncbi:MAG: tetratricopeptide repeat protein [Pseudomonadota bacterium]